jgi:hypothetical protein
MPSPHRVRVRRYGGDSSLTSLTMLHPHGGLPGATVVTEGLFAGGCLSDAAQLVRTGRAARHDFAFFRGAVEWTADGMARRIRRGDWMPCPAGLPPSTRRPCAPGALPDSRRLSESWRVWARAIRSLGEAGAPLLRLRPAALREVIAQVAHTVAEQPGALGHGANLMPHPDEEAAAYAASDPYKA